MNTLTTVIEKDEGTLRLPAWAGYQSRQGRYGMPGSDEPSEGDITLSIGGDMGLDDTGVLPAHANAFDYLVQHQYEIQTTILHALLSEYRQLQKQYGYEGEEAALMPDVTSIHQFRSLIGLSTVHIMNVVRDEVAYVGYQFGCTWDPEHGLGIMMHKDRIVDIGDVSSAFLTWVAEGDLEREMAEE